VGDCADVRAVLSGLFCVAVLVQGQSCVIVVGVLLLAVA